MPDASGFVQDCQKLGMPLQQNRPLHPLRDGAGRFIIENENVYNLREAERVRGTCPMTISDIAKMAGVSSAAVSRYLNGGPLSEQKREAIREVVEKTG